jgi:hypothetical protein
MSAEVMQTRATVQWWRAVALWRQTRADLVSASYPDGNGLKNSVNYAQDIEELWV